MNQPINYDSLDLLKNVIGDDLKPILTSFLKITPDVFNKLKHAIEQNNAQDVQHHAHTIKGSSANIGAIEVPDISMKLEDMGRAQLLEQANSTFLQLESAYQRLSVAVEDYMNKI